MKNNSYRNYIENFLHNIFSGLVMQKQIHEMTDEIIKISDFVNNKYPDINIVERLVDNILKYKIHGSMNCLTYIRYLSTLVKTVKKKECPEYSVDSVLNMIIDDNRIYILFACFFDDAGYAARDMCYKDVGLFEIPLISKNLIDNISSELNKSRLSFLMCLIGNKDANANINISEKINKQNYPDVIKKIIGNSEVEIKLFELIYPYFDTFSTFNWYKLYKLMIKYKDKENVVEYFTKNIKPFVDYISISIFTDIEDYNMSSLFWNMTYISEDKDRDFLPELIDKDIPLLLLFQDLSIFRSSYEFLNDKILLTGFKFSDVKLDYTRMIYYLGNIIYKLYYMNMKNSLLVKTLIRKIFVKDQNRFCILSELINSYSHLFNLIITPNFCSDLSLNNSLVALVDKDDREIKVYINVIGQLIKLLNRYEKLLDDRDKFFTFKIKNRKLPLSQYTDFCEREDMIAIAFIYMFTFLVNKNDINGSDTFIRKFDKLFTSLSNNQVVIDDTLMEFIYSNSESKIRTILHI